MVAILVAVFVCPPSSRNVSVSTTSVATDGAGSCVRVIFFESSTPPAETLVAPNIGSSMRPVAITIPFCEKRKSAPVTVAPTFPLVS